MDQKYSISIFLTIKLTVAELSGILEQTYPGRNVVENMSLYILMSREFYMNMTM